MATTFTSLIKEMPLPDTWDGKVFDLKGKYTAANFKNALLYARERSEYLARGSSRAVFKLQYEGRPTILKLAMNRAGLAQNAQEAKVLFGPKTRKLRIIVPGIDYDEINTKPLWVHQEYARSVSEEEFKQKAGEEVDDLIDRVATWQQSPSTIPASEIRAWPVAYDVFLLWKALGFDEDFLGDLVSTMNWGLYKNRLVIVDVGLTSDVFQKHYDGPAGMRLNDPIEKLGWKHPYD